MHEKQLEQRGGAPEASTTMVLTPHIYVASLCDNTEGRPHGAWIDATQMPSDIEASIAWMLHRSPTPGAQAWAIHNHDGFAGIRIDEHEDLGHVSLLAGLLKQHGPAFAAWAEICDDPNLYESFEVGYIGHFSDLAACGRQVAEELGYVDKMVECVPDFLAPYVVLDEEAFARDLWLNGNIVWSQATDGGIWVFDNQLEVHQDAQQ